MIDDYAHHPSAVTATLRAVRHRYPGRRIVAVFEPHQVSRTERLLGDFALALSQAGRVLLAPIFPARETPTLETCEQLSRSLATAVGAKGTPCHAVASLDRLLATLDDALQSGDVLLTMGAGIIDRIPHEFTGRFQRHSEAG